MSQTTKSEDRTTTVGVSTEVRDALFERKNPGDSYDDVLRRVLEI